MTQATGLSRPWCRRRRGRRGRLRSGCGAFGVGGGGGAAKADGFSDPTSIMKNAASLGKSAWNAFQDWNNQPLDLSAPGIAAPNADFGGGVGNWGGTGGLLGGFYANGGGVAGFADGGAPSFDERFSGDAPAIFAPTDGPVCR